MDRQVSEHHHPPSDATVWTVRVREKELRLEAQLATNVRPVKVERLDDLFVSDDVSSSDVQMDSDFSRLTPINPERQATLINAKRKGL